MKTTTPILATTLGLLSIACTMGPPRTEPAPERASATPPAEAPHLTRVGKVEFFADTTIVAFPVKSIAASRAWYERVLGSTLVYEVPEQRWCEISTPAQGTLIGLHEQADAKAGAANALGIGVTDMKVAREHLVANGVKLEGDVVEIPGIVKLLYFTDPDGNRMWFYSGAD